jgi:hypothetical protein
MALIPNPRKIDPCTLRWIETIGPNDWSISVLGCVPPLLPLKRPMFVSPNSKDLSKHIRYPEIHQSSLSHIMGVYM